MIVNFYTKYGNKKEYSYTVACIFRHFFVCGLILIFIPVFFPLYGYDIVFASLLYAFLNSFKQIKKTLHITRKTFVTYINFYCSHYNENYTKGLTHKNEGIDQEDYNKALNLDILKEIINKIDLKNLERIEEQIKLTENRFLKNNNS